MLKLSPEEQSVYCMYDPSAFSPVPGTWGAGGATFVELTKVKTAALKEALALAHSLLRQKTSGKEQGTRDRQQGTRKT
jgi:hypothetical protein